MPGLSKGPIRIILLDAQTLFRVGLRYIIERQPGMEVVGETGSLDDGIGLITQLNPDIILFDLNLECQPQAEITSSLVRVSGSARLILVTGLSDPQVQQRAVEDGIVGVISKTQSPETLLKAIEKVHSGEVWLERSLIANVLVRLSRNQPLAKVGPETASINSLSEREKEVVKLIGLGFKNKRISTELCISETTVRHHLTSIYDKLGVSDRLELLVFAHRYGLVTAHKE
jgi:two-component system, NarL family, nitrate/nitrite response regulator NarL